MSAKGRVVGGIWAVWALALVIAILYAVIHPFQVWLWMAYVILGLSVVVIVLMIVPPLGLLLAKAPPTAPAVLHWALGVVAFGAILSVLIGFKWRFIGKGTEAPPPSITDVRAPGQFDSLLAYAKRIPYDAVTHGTADSALLTDTILLPDSTWALYTVKAWIAPARDANLNSYDDLGEGRGKGRVVARITVDSVGRLWIARSQEAITRANRDLERASRVRGGGVTPSNSQAIGLGYQKLNLPAGISYVWVDNLKIEHDTTGKFRALIIPDRAGGKVDSFPVSEYSRYYRSKHTFANFPMARWVLHNSNCTNVPCGNHGCCQSCP